MIAKKTAAAGLIALAALVAAVPASAGGPALNLATGETVYAGDGGHGSRDRGEHRWGRRGGDDRYYGTLTPREVRQVLRDKGYRQVQYLDRRGRIYEARATNRRGHRVGLIVSARTGAVLNAYRL